MRGDASTIHDAAHVTGWSARMLRYLDRLGFVAAPRSASGYRLYGPVELERLRSLRALLDEFDVSLADLAFARRLRDDERLQTRIDAWLTDATTRAPRSRAA